MNLFLSKTRIKQGFQCPKSLYLQIYKKHLAIFPFTPNDQKLFTQAHQVQKEAYRLFPKGQAVTAPYWNYDRALDETRQALENQSPYIYEAFFAHSPLCTRVNILEVQKHFWNIIEIKSSLSIKPDHILDAAIQKYILTCLNHTIKQIFILHINKKSSSKETLFIKQDVTAEVELLQDSIKQALEDFKSIVKQKTEPKANIGLHCKKPYPCRFTSYCWKHIPKPSVFDIPSLEEESRWDYYKQNKIHLQDIPDSPLLKKQKVYKKVQLTGRAYIHKQNIKKEISKWKPPFYFLDFETVSYPIPQFKSTMPFQHIPFQFSCFKQKEPFMDFVASHFESKASPPLSLSSAHQQAHSSKSCVEPPIKKSLEDSHFYHKDEIPKFTSRPLDLLASLEQEKHFLHSSTSDPRQSLIESLLSFIGHEGSIASYYKEFELLRIKEMAEHFPKFKKPLLELQSRFVDPLPILREHVCLKEFGSSWSLKSTAPALLGDQWNYSRLQVPDGLAAQNMFEKMIELNDNDPKKALIRKNLLLYCRQDTLCLAGVIWWMFYVTQEV